MLHCWAQGFVEGSGWEMEVRGRTDVCCLLWPWECPVCGYNVSGRGLAFSGEASASLPASRWSFCQITNQSSLDEVEDQGRTLII